LKQRSHTPRPEANYFVLLLANPIHRVIGRGGANILIRVMGLILAFLAVEKVLEGVLELFSGERTL
jgi:small neutral amino acid transporter SnatA (MarC family)